MSEKGNIVLAGLMPHPPIVVPGVGGGREREAEGTCRAMSELSRRVVAAKPELLVLISPHSPRERGMFGYFSGERLRGDLARFMAPQERIDLPNALPFLAAFARNAASRQIRTWTFDPDEPLDHGAVVPLWYLADAGWSGPTAVIGLNYPGEGQLEALGEAIAAAAREPLQRTAVIASGDMSHRLKPGAPGGFHPEAHRFDERFVELVRAGDYDNVRQFDASLQDIAGEDVVDSSVVAMAATGFKTTHHEVLNYEGPFGVGYSIAVFFSSIGEDDENTGGNEAMNEMKPEDLPRLARRTVEAYINHREFLPEPETSNEFLNKRAGVFVTIRLKNGELRGCIGSISPRTKNIVSETMERAIAAATQDPRFPAVTPEELDDLEYEISVMHPPEPIESEQELDPSRYGVIVSASGGRGALMLPSVPGLDTVEKQLSATRRKAGLSPRDKITLERFEVDKFEEH